MCAVIGFSVSKVESGHMQLINNLFLQSMIRGKHATGLSYVKGGKVITIKKDVPANKFISGIDFKDCINEDGGIYLIGHTRYSTSDIKYNQPIANDTFSIAHNGVISQDVPAHWKYKCETSNDSELVLQSFAHDQHPLHDFMHCSMAVTGINVHKNLSGFRNHKRPLWYSLIENGIIFTSTSDIANRAGIIIRNKCDMFMEYQFMNGQLHTYQMAYDKTIKDLQ